MKYLSRITLILFFAAVVLVVITFVTKDSATSEAAPLQQGTCNIVLSPDVPHDAIIPQSHIGNPTAIQFDFDTLSWNTFIALNWPADPNYNGKPDKSKKIGQQDYSPVVWESYKQSYDVSSPTRRAIPYDRPAGIPRRNHHPVARPIRLTPRNLAGVSGW